MKHQAGNTLVEYGLIGSLVLLVGIAGCLSFGINFESFFQGLKTEMADHNQVAVSVHENTKSLSSSTTSSVTSG